MKLSASREGIARCCVQGVRTNARSYITKSLVRCSESRVPMVMVSNKGRRRGPREAAHAVSRCVRTGAPCTQDSLIWAVMCAVEMA